MTTLQVKQWQFTNGTVVGNVIQQQYFFYNTYQVWTNTADGAAQDTGLVVSITPRYNTSKILVLCAANINHGNSTCVVRGRIVRTGPSTTYSPSSVATYCNNWTTTMYGPAGTSAAYMPGTSTIYWLDSPSTTQACTYRLQIASNTTGGSIMINGNAQWLNTWSGSSTITVMEIAA